MGPSGRDVAAVGTGSASTPLSQSARTALVLVIDDDEDIANLIRHSLHTMGYRTITAPDGRRALALAQQHRPNLVLLDWRLPGDLHGTELVRRLRELRPGRLPVVVISGDLDALSEANDVGVEDYLPKPFLLEDLLHVVDEHCP